MGFKKIEGVGARGRKTVVGAGLATTGNMIRLSITKAAYRALGEPERADVLRGVDEHAGAFALVPAENGARKVSHAAKGATAVTLGQVLAGPGDSVSTRPCRVELTDGMLIVWPPEGYTLREFD